MESGTPEAKTVKRNKGQFVPGDPRIKAGPGRRGKTPEYKALEKMTRQQVQDALERMVGPALERLLKIVAKGAEPEALKSVALLLDRAVGAVPSANYLQARIESTGPSYTALTSEAMAALAQRTLDRIAAQKAEDAGGG